MSVRVATVVVATAFVTGTAIVWVAVTMVDQISEAISIIDPRNQG